VPTAAHSRADRDDKEARHSFIALRVGLDTIWEDVEEAGIFAKET
jgi:hypothetical protein